MLRNLLQQRRRLPLVPRPIVRPMNVRCSRRRERQLAEPRHSLRLSPKAGQPADVKVQVVTWIELAAPIVWLSKPPRYVVFGLLFPRHGENLVGRVVFDQLTGVKEGRVVGDARGLLHVVPHDDDGELLLQVENRVLDAARRDGVECWSLAFGPRASLNS